jgi:hypothetical protein
MSRADQHFTKVTNNKTRYLGQQMHVIQQTQATLPQQMETMLRHVPNGVFIPLLGA